MIINNIHQILNRPNDPWLTNLILPATNCVLFVNAYTALI